MLDLRATLIKFHLRELPGVGNGPSQAQWLERPSSTLSMGGLHPLSPGTAGHERPPPSSPCRNSTALTRATTSLTKVCLVKAMVFPVVIFGCESWAIKKADCQRIDAFELWCWRRILRVPWTARTSNQSILKEISPEYSLEGLMLKLKFQCLGN